MRIILNNVEVDDIADVANAVEEMQRRGYKECIYKFLAGSVFYVKKTNTGYSVSKEPST